MSIQGQFYLIWFVLFSLVFILLKKKTNLNGVKIINIALSLLFLTSFIYSIYLTAVNQPWAYFDTFTRVWEFSLGGIVALLISKIVLRKTISAILGWIGLLAIISCGVLFQVSTVFPGYAALWPTIGGLLIIIAGSQGGTFGVHRLLGSKPFMKMGSISYAFYL